MSNDLADMIRARFTPFAFTCECNGTEPECFATRRNPSMMATHETIERIAKFIEDYYEMSAE
jgi:hypothetical protein